MPEFTQTAESAQAVVDENCEFAAEGGTRYPGMTYEQGVISALQWVLGDQIESPMDDD